MGIIITDIAEALRLMKTYPNYYRVISISNSKNIPLLVKYIKQLNSAKEILYLKFDDVTEEFSNFARTNKQCRLATVEDCQQALEFLARGGECLVHCHAGVSRSTGIVLGYFLSKYEKYQDAVDKLIEIRDCACPNSYILKLFCQILGYENDYQEILSYIEQARKKRWTSKMGSLSVDKKSFQ